MTFFWNAGNLYALALRSHTASKEDGSHALAAVILSVSSLEGFINELAAFAKVRADCPDRLIFLNEIWDDLQESVPLEAKYLLISSVLEKPFDKGRNPYQDFAVLVRLRNRLVHMKPEMISGGTLSNHPEKLLEALKVRSLIEEFRTGETYSWYDQIRNEKVGLWACEVAAQMVVHIVDSIPEGSFKSSLENYVKSGFRPPAKEP